MRMNSVNLTNTTGMFLFLAGDASIVFSAVLTHRLIRCFRDWSVVHLMGKRLLPYKTLVPNKLQVAHIGLKGGLHEKDISNMEARRIEDTNELMPFHGKIEDDSDTLGGFMDAIKVHDKGYGGWGHPADHEHCMKLFQYKKHKSTWKQLLRIQ